MTASAPKMSDDIRYCEMDDGAQIAVRRWSGPRAQRLLVSHGNGLAVEGFRDFAEALFDRFEVIAFDLRNHGLSPRSPHPERPWPRYIADIPQIFTGIQHLFGEAETHGAFHSMAAASTLCAQTVTPSPWASLTLFEPPVVPSDNDNIRDRFNAVQHGMGKRAQRRRRAFAAPSDLAASFRRAKTFDGIPDRTLERLAAATLLRIGSTPGEPWELVLLPEAEALNFAEATELSAYWDALTGIETPIQLIAGDTAVHDLPYLIDIAEHMSGKFGYPISTIPNTNHFMQLLQPQLCAQRVLDFVQHAERDQTAINQQA